MAGSALRTLALSAAILFAVSGALAGTEKDQPPEPTKTGAAPASFAEALLLARKWEEPDKMRALFEATTQVMWGPAVVQGIYPSKSDPIIGQETAPWPSMDKLTREALAAGRGNLLRWRDHARAKAGLFSHENNAINEAALARYNSETSAQWGKPKSAQKEVAYPSLLPVGPRLPYLEGLFAYFYERDGAPRTTFVMGRWNDAGSNPGEPTQVTVTPLVPEDFCGPLDVSAENVALIRDIGRSADDLLPQLDVLGAELQRDAPARVPYLSVKNVTFTRLPDEVEVNKFFPRDALQEDAGGGAMLACDISSGALKNCAIESEKPAGKGFGVAAQSLAAATMKIEPKLKNGEPSEGRKLCVKVRFLSGY